MGHRNGTDLRERLLVVVEGGDEIFPGFIRTHEGGLRGGLGFVEIRLGPRFLVFRGRERHGGVADLFLQELQLADIDGCWLRSWASWVRSDSRLR